MVYEKYLLEAYTFLSEIHIPDEGDFLLQIYSVLLGICISGV